MAWFNSGLNTIKGQLSNLAQEVLADTHREEEAIDTIQALEQAQIQCDELVKICSERDLEIATLRKQIADLQSRVSESSISSGDKSSKSGALKNVSLEDSWCWADNTATNSSESDNEKRAPPAGRLKKLQKENKSLSEKVATLEQENAQLNSNIEELDAQHQLAIQNVLEVKTDLQHKLNSISHDYEALKKEHATKFLNTEKETETLRKKLENLQSAYTKYVEENVQLKTKVDSLSNELTNSKDEQKELQDLLNKRDKDVAELVEKINKSGQSENEEKTVLEQKINELTREIENLRSNQIPEESEKKLSESSSGKQSVDDDFIVVPVADTESPTTSPINREELEEKLQQLENRIAELTVENGTYQSKVQDLEMEKSLSVSQLEMSIEELKVKVGRSDREISSLQEKINSLTTEKCDLETVLVKQKLLTEELTKANETLKQEMETINDNMSKCEANASDVESKLMMENVDLQKKLIDLESSLNRSSTSSGNTIEMSHIKNLLSNYTRIELSEISKDSIDAAFRQIRDKIWQIEVLEKNLSQMSEEILDLQDNKLSWDHEKKTLEADIGQYIIQCDELMKNNEILLNELENYKRNKLETISENNEENLLLLENQLDECRSLNTTLEEEYRELNEKISDLENEKHELLNQLRSVQDINANLVAERKELKEQVASLEQEKCNLHFEMNEMNSGDKKYEVDLQLSQYKGQCADLEKQIERLNADLSDAVLSIQTQKQSLTDSKKENEQLEQVNRQKDLALSKMDARIKELMQEEKDSSVVDALKIENEHLQKKLDVLNEEKISYLEKLAKLEGDLLATAELEKAIESLNFEKNEIIKTLQGKHAENMQYYMEIQRLSQLLQIVEQEKNQLNSRTCENCEKLSIKIAEDAKEINKLQDQITFLKEKSDILTNNLLSEESKQKLLQQDKANLAETNANLQKDLDRLRQHLVELEDSHTQETIDMQNLIDETKAQMNALQEEVSKSSHAYTSASIRANQHAETLQAQYALVTQQRDELVAKLSLAEDRESKNQAALVNLQCALEQFQNDKENEIKIATQRLLNALQVEKDKHAKLEADIALLNQQLADANQGLRAASRLSDQLESSQMTISSLQEEVRKLIEKNTSLSDELKKSESSQTDKIEKSLIKSLVIGYVVSGNANDKNQVLRMITSVLDFTQAETDKVGLNKQQSKWFGSIMPPIPGSQTKDNLVQAFVHFLEQESQPRSKTDNMPNLLNITSQSTTVHPSAEASTSASAIRKSSNCDPMVRPMSSGTVQPILLNTTSVDDFAPSRNSSSILKDILSDS